MAMVPERAAGVGLAAKEYRTTPARVPFKPAVIAIHDALLAALHSQPDGPLTATVPSPACGRYCRAADNVSTQGPTGTGWPASRPARS